LTLIKKVSNDFYISSILPHSGIIIKICRAYTDTQEDFEDYYQEVSLQIWKSRNNFKGQSEWSTWVYRLALNVCMTLLKKQKNNLQNTTSIINAEEIPVESNFFSDDLLNKLYYGIRQLSEIDRAIILLYLEEKQYREIAEIIGTNPNNIGVRIKRIKERLTKILDGKID
jgi:RNA polymerase sigma-70 factor, ECF subfamily